MTGNPIVIKLGGALLENDAAHAGLWDALAGRPGERRRPVVLVHGGGCLVDDLLKALGMKSEKKKGLRVTPPEQIPYITGALAGTANKLMLAKAKARGAEAVGLCLSDGGMTEITRLDEELGAVGSAAPGSPKLPEILFGAGYVPVVSSIGFTGDGTLMNVNADQAAAALAVALGADLALLSDVEGILDRDGRLIGEIDEKRAAALIADGTISGGMEVKVRAALKAAKSLGRPLCVGGWSRPETIGELIGGGRIGTAVLPE